MVEIPLGRYRHFKGGEYDVIGIAQHSETEERFVVYRSVVEPSRLWIRPFAMFTEEVEGIGEAKGTRVPRFQFVRPPSEQV